MERDEVGCDVGPYGLVENLKHQKKIIASMRSFLGKELSYLGQLSKLKDGGHKK